jgi:CheY-like chemotaxis protein
MLNRRAHRRTRVQRDLEVIPLETGRRTRSFFGANKAPSPTEGNLVDIGCGGMAVEIKGKLDVGTQVDINITGASGKVQRARGTVRHVRGDNGTRTIGIAFTEPVVALGDPARTGEPVAAEGGEPDVLVIDDDPGVRSVLQRFLEARGMKVTVVASAEEALELLRAAEPALMLLDLRMDGMTGVEMLETMKAEGLHCPNIWAMSGMASDDEALAALSLGAHEFINKPFDLDHLDYCLQLIAPVL